jgi:hypothetical protein
MCRTSLAFACFLSVVGAALPRAASAHHESWVLRNSGMECAFHAPGTPGQDNFFVSTANNAPFTRSVSCPVTLAARWGSSSPAYPVARWARAYSALVYVNNIQGSSLSCSAQARLGSGTMRFSRTVSTTTGGDQPLVVNSSSNWGGDLETFKGDTIRSLNFHCQLPNSTSVLGYKVRMCIRNASCRDVSVPDGETWASEPNTTATEPVQASAIDCKSTNPNVARSEFGIRNHGTDFASVLCPIVPSVDDTNEMINRRITSTSVYYRGVTPSTSDESLTCQLVWKTRSVGTPFAMDEFWSSSFIFNGLTERMDQSATARVGVGLTDVAMAVWCDLPPGFTLLGVTTRMGVPPVAGGR